MSDQHSKIGEVLGKLGVTPVEYEAMICPYYDIHLEPREMASWTVLEHGMCCGEKCAVHTADDYLAAINGMIEKGWLAIQGPVPRTMARTENVPRRPKEPPPAAGTVVFTKAGYLLHRRIVRALYGRGFLDKIDAFTVHDGKLKELRFYAQTKRHCEKLLRMARQRTSLESISHLVGFAVDILSTQDPTKIGRWCPSEFLTHRSGYTAAVKYKRRRRPRFSVPELELESWVEFLVPVSIYGTIKGDRFSFSDHPSWKKPTFEDKDAVFRWVFIVDGEPIERVPDGAILKNETKPAGYHVDRNVLFSLEEGPYRKRTWMLSVGQSKTILTHCVVWYLKERKHI